LTKSSPFSCNSFAAFSLAILSSSAFSLAFFSSSIRFASSMLDEVSVVEDVEAVDVTVCLVSD